jgi:hypothetical protein
VPFFEIVPRIKASAGVWRKLIRGFSQEIHHRFAVFAKLGEAAGIDLHTDRQADRTVRPLPEIAMASKTFRPASRSRSQPLARQMSESHPIKVSISRINARPVRLAAPGAEEICRAELPCFNPMPVSLTPGPSRRFRSLAGIMFRGS